MKDIRKDKIVKAVKEYLDGEFLGYSLITEYYPEGHKIHPLVNPHSLRDRHCVAGYSMMLKEYFEKHPNEK